MADGSVSIRLGVDGDADVKTRQQAVGQSGEQAFDGIAAAADRASSATDGASAAVDRQAAKWARLAAAAQAAQVASDSQARLNAAFNIGATPKSASDSAAVFAAAAAAEEDLEKRTAALRAEIDPLWAAQQKLNTSVAEANALMAAGKISAAEQTVAITAAQAAYAEAEKAAKAMAGGVALSTVQMQELGAVVHRTVDSVAAGMNPLRILAMEGARTGVAFGSGPGGLGGILKLLASETAIAAYEVTGFVAVLFGAEAAGMAYEAQQKRISDAVSKTSAAQKLSVEIIDQVAQAQQAAGGLSARMAQDVELSLATVGRVSATQLPLATTAAQQLAKALGTDLPAATAELAKDLADPGKGVQDLSDKLHALTVAQIEQVKALADEGDKTAAVNLLLQDFVRATADATDHANMFARAGHEVHVLWDKATDSVGKFVAKIVGMPSGDTLTRIKQDLVEIARLQNDGPAGQQLLTHYQQDLAAQQAKLKTDQLAQSQRDAADASQKLRTAFDGLDPQLSRIQQIQARQVQLRNSLNDPKALSDAGLTQAQAQAAIAEGDREIKQLKDKADGRNKHAETLAREAASEVANAQASLRVADAYLQSSAAGERAEATRKALTDATKKGTDADAEAQRQLALMIANSAAAGAKSATEISDRTGVQAKLNDAVAAGTLTSQQAAKQMAVEQAIRPQLIAYALAEGTAKEKLGLVIARLRDAYAASNAEQARTNLLNQADTAQDRIDQLKLEAQYAADLTGQRERLAAVLKTTQSPDFQASTDERAQGEAIIQAMIEADQQLATRRAQYVAQTQRGLTDQIELEQAELGLVGKTADAHDHVLDRLRAIQALKAQGIDLSSAEAQAILAQVDAEDAVKAHLRAVNDNWNELKSAGDRFIDDVLNPQAWSDWGQMGKQVIDDLISEFVKLALANPLKNALFGEQLPTLGGFGGLIGKLFGGSGSVSAASIATSADFVNTPLSLPAFANGTYDAPGGLSWVGENGPELINLPPHSQVVPAAQTRQLLSNAANANVQISMPITLDARGAGPREVDMLSARLDQLERTLPGRIVATVNDGISRRRIRSVA